jgi:AraC-like DNA-binding protein
MICIIFYEPDIVKAFSTTFAVKEITFMEYLQFQPVPQLQPYVRSIFWISGGYRYGNPQPFRVLADGCPGLIIQENQKSFLDNRGEILPSSFIHGLSTKYSVKTAISAYSNIVICFQPNALKSIFGIDASELTDSYINLDDYTNSHRSEILNEESNISQKIRLISEFLMAQIERHRKPEAKIRFIIEKLSTDHTASCLKDLCREMYLSERTLERIMKAHTGVSPKQFFRISRFQAALHHMSEKPFSNLSEIAYAYGYSDQSHYIRDFRALSGISPKQFLKHLFPLKDFMPDVFN